MSLPVDAASWLRSIGLGQYAELFASERIDLDGIREVSDEQLRGLGIQSHAHRRKLMAEVETLRGRGMSQRSDAYAADFEHRHITVLFADIVGSTALWTALDSERLHDVMGRFWGTVDEIIEQHGGVIEKHIGDAVMATFGAPITHGDDPARAVHAALKIHAAMPGLSRVLGHPVEVHVGVASGDVVAGRLGKGARAQYAVLGQPVILAARLHDVAAAGETLVAESTWRAVAEQFRGAETDPVSLKGFSEPVSAWRVVHVHADRTDRPFVGREEEIGRVRDELEAARQIGQARVVYLRGEAGVGKTRLAEEAGRLAREQGFAVHATQVLDFGLGTGRGALARLTRSLLGIPAAADEATTRRRLREDLEIRRGLEAADEPFLEALLDLPLGERTRQVLDSLDAAGLRQGLAKVFGDLVEAAATVAPRMLVVEDLHWADRTTLQVIDHLCARTTSAPVLLLLTARLEDDPRIAADAAAVRRLDLPPLPPEHTRALAERLGDAHDPLIEECVIRSGGNPFYLEQLLRFSAETTSGAIPPTIRELVQARMDHLPETDKAVLRAAAVLGPEFPVDALHHVLDTDHVSCARLVSALLLLERDEGFAFGHTLIRESVYGTMASEMRRRLHLRAAQWFEPRNLPLHAEHLDRAGDPGAARAYLGASEWASERYRFRTAAELAGRGLALAGNEPLDRSLTWSLAHSRGRALLRLADYATAVGAFDLALGLAASADERYQGWMGRAQCLHLSDRYYESLAALDEAETSARATDRPGRIAETHTWRGRVFLALGEIEGCMRENTLAVSEAERSASDKIQAAALSGLGYACYQRGWMLSAYRHFDDCIRLCEARGMELDATEIYHMRGHTLMYQTRLDEALEQGRVAVETARRIGHVRAELSGRRLLAVALLERGEVEAARVHLDRALALVRELRSRRYEPMVVASLARAAWLSGDLDEARARIREAVALQSGRAADYYGPLVIGFRLLIEEDANVRVAASQEAERLLARGTVSHNHLWYLRDAIELALREQAFDRALAYARRLEGFTAQEPVSWVALHVERARLLARAGRGERDPDLRRALSDLRDRLRDGGLRPALGLIDEALAW